MRYALTLATTLVLVASPAIADGERGPALLGEVPPEITPESLHCYWAAQSEDYRDYRRDGTGAGTWAQYDRLGLMFQELGEKYGVRWDLAFLQMLLETGYLAFDGEVERSQKNAAGLGADGFWVREGDGERVQLIRSKGVWYAIPWALGTGKKEIDDATYKFEQRGDGKGRAGFQPYKRVGDTWVETDELAIHGRGDARPMLREEGATWYTGDRYATLREGVEAFLQHLALYSGTPIPKDQLVSPYSQRVRSHVVKVHKAWRAANPGKSLSVSDLGTRIQVYAGEKKSAIYTFKSGYGKSVIKALKALRAKHVARDTGYAQLLRFYDSTNAAHMRGLRAKLADLQAQIKVFEDVYKQRVANHERTQRGIREGIAENLEWHDNNLKRIRGDAKKARPHDKKILEGQAKDIDNQLKTKEIHLRIGGVGRPYAAWEAILAQNEKDFAAFQKEFAKGEFPVRVSAWGATTRNAVEAEIAKVEQELAECLAGTKAYVLVGGSPAMSRADVLELLKESGGPCGRR